MDAVLYPGIAFSPQTALADNIGAADTIIKVSDISAFPPAPNLATIGTDEEGETILYTAKTDTALSGCTRGVEGTAKAWSAGESIGRNFTAKDHNDLIAAIRAARVDVDDTPAKSSPNPVSSGGTYAALRTKQDALTGPPGQVVRFDGMGLPYAAEGWSNRNLIINWDLRRPVNRQGKTEYTGSGSYCIDRYIIRNNVTVQVTDGGLVISRSDTVFAGISQPIKDGPKLLAGKTVTLSALIDELSCGSVEIFLGNSNAPHLASNSYGTVRTKAAGLISTTITLPDELPNDYLTAFLWIDSEANGGTVGSVKPAAWKLELGDHQTLARQNEDGAWELIDPPDYDLQYALCSLYSPSTGEWVGYQHSNLNLLRNWYFPRPINQRKTLSDTLWGRHSYGIDGWASYEADSTKWVEDEGIYLVTPADTTSTSQIVEQRLESSQLPDNAVLTFSALVNRHLISVTFTVPSANNIRYDTQVDGIGMRLQFLFDSPSSGICTARVWKFGKGTVLVTAAKLEQGPVQTLAHQDANGNWVLNDPPPNKALELLKCQRYQMYISSGSLFSGVLTSSGTEVRLVVPTPAPMRTVPTLVDGVLSNLRIVEGSNMTPTVTSYKVFARRENQIEVSFTVEGVVAKNNTPCAGYVQGLLDANL